MDDLVGAAMHWEMMRDKNTEETKIYIFENHNYKNIIQTYKFDPIIIIPFVVMIE